MDLALLSSLLVGVSIFLVFFGLNSIYQNRNSTVQDRVAEYATRQAKTQAEAQGAGPSGKKDRYSRLPGAGNAQIATELARADLKITPGEFQLITIIAALGAGVLGYVLGHDSIVIAGVAGLVGFFVPRWYVKHLQGKRLKAFDSQLGDTIVLLANSLRSGYSLLQAMETASKELTPPISTEFQRVTREIGLGLSVQEALANFVRRIPSPDLDLLVTAINVQHEVGGNLAEILDTMAYTIRERVRIVGEIRSITAQQRWSSYILTGIPGILAVILYVLNPGYISKLWSDTCGWIMMGTGIIMVIAGYFVIQRIISIEV